MVATPERRTHCVRIESVRGDIVRIAIGYPVDLVMGNGSVYLGGIYGEASGTSATVSGGPSVLDLGSVYDADTITRNDVQSGKWDGAKIYSFFTDWAYPVEDEEPDRLYTLGKVREQDDRYTVEMLSLLDMLNKTYGRTITPGCVWTLADSRIDGSIIASDRSYCKIDPELITFTASVTAVTSATQFMASGLGGSQHDDYFGFGEIIFTTGNNAGAAYKFVKKSTTAGAITLAQPFYHPIEVGDQFRIKAGCRKRFFEDCIVKFGNGKRFGGFPHVPQRSTVSKFGDQ